MKYSWRLARLRGININIHWSFSFVILWVLVQGYIDRRPLDSILLILAGVLLVFGCIMLHELGHALTALSLNVDVKQIVLLPFGGLAQIQTVPERPFHEMLIAAAGPLVNLILVFALLPVLVATGGPALITSIFIAPVAVIDYTIISFFRENNLSGLVLLLIISNAILFAFNLIPAFPMDGGRILRSGLSLFISYKRATRLSMVFGIAIALTLIVLALRQGRFGLAVVGLFIIFAARPMRG